VFQKSDIIRGAVRTISKYLSNIPGKNDINEIEKTAILDAAHIL
jgi:hypothetical protein